MQSEIVAVKREMARAERRLVCARVMASSHLHSCGFFAVSP
jgi:hypothetical protein